MNEEQDPLIPRLREGLDRLTGDIATEPPELGDVTATRVHAGAGSRLWLLGAAAAAVVAVAAAGIFVVTRDSDSQPEVAPLDSATAVAEDHTEVTKPTTIGGGDQLYRAVATVLESPEHDAELCLGAIMESYPPQCGGLLLTNWTWSGLTSERASGTRWGEFVVVGTYDRAAQAFTLTQPARDAEPGDFTQGPDIDFSTPCDEPAGGWPEATEQELTDAAQRIGSTRGDGRSDTGTTPPAAMVEGFGGLWLGRDPFVLNVRVVGDLAAADDAIREVFDGPLCLIPSERTLAELQDIQNAADLGPALSASYVDVEAGIVVFETVAPDAELERQLAERYGDAVEVRVTGLIPIAPGEDPDPGPGTTPGTAGPVDGPAPVSAPEVTAELPGPAIVTTDEYRAIGTVLEDDSHGPQLCFGVDDSYPPQCEGIDLPNWNWNDVQHEGGEDAAEPTSARWGDYVVVGTYDRDANTFTLTKPVRTVEESDFREERERDSSPCEAPVDGWPAATQQELVAGADRIDPSPGSEGSAIVDGLAGSWLSREPFVLNVTVTGDAAAAERQIRTVYDGPLCVLQAHYTEAELIELSQDIYIANRDTIDSTGVAVERNVVEIVLVAPDPEFEASLEERYGDAIEVIGSRFQPVGDGSTRPNTDPTIPSDDSTEATVPPAELPTPIDPQSPVTSLPLD